jgi:tetratricopeptide (TPR) repeat protein
MPNSLLSGLQDTLSSALESHLQALRHAWQQAPSGNPPRWQDYLPPSGPCPAPFLFGLLCADVLGRIHSGKPALLAETYFQNPRLREAAAADADTLLALLIRREYHARCRCGQRPRRQEYAARFPQLQDDLRDLVPSLDCPSCGKEVLLADEDACDAVCSACGGRVLLPEPNTPGPDSTDSSFASKAPTVPPTVAPSVPAGTAAASSPGLRRLGRYEIGEEIARGGMGAVLLAHDPILNRDLAIKVLKPHLDHRGDLVSRFVAEAQITAQLPHPGIVPVHELGHDDSGRPYLVMKLVRGQTLAELLAHGPATPQDLPHLLGIFEQVCQAVAFAHSHRVIHRDLKPANVMVGRFGEVQVMDWGLAKPLASRERQPPEADPEETAAGEVVANIVRTLRSEGSAGVAESSKAPGATEAGTVLGTPAYMPPEQAAGQIDKLDERCDVFGLGAILCEILTGQPPYVAAQSWRVVYMAALAEQEETCRRLQDCGADAELVALVQECLSADIQKRPRDAGVVAQRVAAYQRGVQERLRQAEQQRITAEAQAREERKRRRLTLVLAAVVLLAGSSGAWLLQEQRGRTQQAAQTTAQVLQRARRLLEEGWQANNLVQLRQALVEADSAVAIAQGAPLAVQQEAAAVQQHVKERLDRAEQDAVLLAGLLNIATPQETGTYHSDAGGQMVAMAQPSVDEQYAGTFRRRWGDIDLDRTSEAEVADRVGAEPPPVVEEILAALDTWMQYRRQQKQPEESWRRLVRLAEQLDHSEHRRRLRVLLAGEWQPPLGLVAELTGVGLPWTALGAMAEGERLRRLLELRSQVNPAGEPVLSVLLLAQGLRAAGDVGGAEGVLREAATTRPSEGVLLDALARLLEERGQLAEALRYYQAGRGLRPNLGAGLARVLSKVGKAAEGETVLRDLISRQPQNPDLEVDLGNALNEQKKPREAEAACRKAIALKPDYALARNNLGVALYEQKKPVDAEAAYRQAIALNPSFALAYSNLGAALGAQREAAQAETACRQAIALKPDFAAAYTNLGATLRDQKKPVEAEAACRQAIALEPDYAEAYTNLALALTDQKKSTEAEAACRKAIALKPDFAAAYNTLGTVLREQKKAADAEAVHRKAIALEPDYPEAYNNLGIALREQRKAAAAEAAFRKAIELKPDYALAYTNLGIALRDQKKLEEAVTAFRKAIASKPDLALASFNLGIALRDQNKLAEAEHAYRQAIAQNPDYIEAYNNLGNVLRAQRKPAEAEAAFRQAIALKPDDAMLYSNLGAALNEQKKAAEAEAAQRKAIALNPTVPEAYSNLGIALSEQKKLAEAETAYRKAIALKPDYAEAYNNLGAVLRDQKKLADAVQAFRKADQLLPNHPILRSNLSQAERLLALDGKLAACLSGKEHPSTPQQAIELAGVAAYREQYRAAASFFADAFKNEPKLADDLISSNLYNAACCAALAAAGKGQDTGLGAAERSNLRQQARDWLRAELKALSAVLGKNRAAAPAVQQRLGLWLEDTDLAGLRDAAALAKLPEAERDACKKLWDDVEALRKRCQEK